jgi:hypothetical protein
MIRTIRINFADVPAPPVAVVRERMVRACLSIDRYQTVASKRGLAKLLRADRLPAEHRVEIIVDWLEGKWKRRKPKGQTPKGRRREFIERHTNFVKKRYREEGCRRGFLKLVADDVLDYFQTPKGLSRIESELGHQKKQFSYAEIIETATKRRM